MQILRPQFASAHDWKMQPLQIPTRWAASVSPANALTEYPRPQMVRPRWENLNGLWDYAITPNTVACPMHYDGRILVPFPVESALSGVAKSLEPDQLLWYRRTVTSIPPQNGDRTLLHFGAVDAQATVFLNGREIGTHAGGYDAFTIDITNALKPGDNELQVKVFDPTDAGHYPYGKQLLHPKIIQRYTASSGIWQTVWLETVPRTYIESLTMTPDVDRSQLLLQAKLQGEQEGITLEAIAKDGATTVARQTLNGATALRIEHPRLWSPDNPFLYDLEVRLLKGGRLVDQVKSYFGLRKIEVKRDAAGIERIYLNNRSTFNLGTLDQGFWPDGLYTAPTDAALRFDIAAIKAMGFNTIRKHLKIEPDRWYYHCDRLGIMVWQDLVPPADSSPAARMEFEKEIKEELAVLNNHPSITTWVLFNEELGAYDKARLGRWIEQTDPTRLLNVHSGAPVPRWVAWYKRASSVLSGEIARTSDFEIATDWPVGDMTDTHPYGELALPPTVPGMARVAGEFGALPVFIENYAWNDLSGPATGELAPAEFATSYARLIDKLKVLEANGLSGAIYTQPFDVELEQNGFMTYDRAVIKTALAEMVKINSKLARKAGNYAEVMRDFSAADADLTPEKQRYASLLAQYQSGNRDFAFLRHFALMALRQKDQAHATAAANDYIDRAPRPYSKAVWTFVRAVTRTSKDRGFEILRTHMAEANASLGIDEAQIKLREIIGREAVAPHTASKRSLAEWVSFEQEVAARYGPLGAEAVQGAAMMYYLKAKDWKRFGNYYAKYFATAASRSEYPVPNISYLLFEHVDDPHALKIAVEAARHSMEVPSLGRTDSTDIDLYANLLYKAGRIQEAVSWQEKAVRLDEGQHGEIADRLTRMKAHQPIWRVR